MTDNKEQEWAKELRIAKHKINKGKIPLSLLKKQNEEEIEHFRDRLLDAISKKDWKETQKYYEKIISVRAIQSTIQIMDLENKDTTIEEEKTEKIIKNFFEDCLKLAISIDKIFEKNS